MKQRPLTALREAGVTCGMETWKEFLSGVIRTTSNIGSVGPVGKLQTSAINF